jgi:hypothetical protein
MSRRTKILLLILVSFLLLLLGLYLLFQPFLPNSIGGGRAPAAPTPTAPYIPPSLPVIPTTGTSAGVTTPIPDDLRVLQNQSRIVIERIGSGTSENGFLGYQDVLTQFTANGRTALLAEQRAMQEAHPATGKIYGISTHAAAARLSSGSSGSNEVVIIVEAVQGIDAGDPAHPTSTIAKRADLTFVRQSNGSYLVDRIVWSDLDL